MFCNDWKYILKDYLESEKFKNTISNLEELYKTKNIFPEKCDVFRAFYLTPFNEVKVVIIGQDPYHTKGVADGLAFSSRQSKIPPSLKNIYKELNRDLNIENTTSDLTPWAKQGILLLNKTLTVEESKPKAHANSPLLNWECFTDFVIKKLSERNDPIIFVLWGNHAKKIKPMIDSHHFILESSHPSPLSCNRGFLGSGVFSKINKILKNMGKTEINFKI